MRLKLSLPFILIYAYSYSQLRFNEVNLSFLNGNVLPHTEDMHHLIENHPTGIMLTLINKTNGEKDWHKLYNYPDYGTYFIYQDFKSKELGEIYSIGGLYNFYFLNRKLQFKVAQGLALATNPYHKTENSKNKAFGSKIVANTNFGLSYINENIYKNIGFHAGILFTHYSNGRTKSPNSGINTYLLDVGINYNFKPSNKIVDTLNLDNNYKLPLRYNFVLRTGFNESPIIRSGQYPFYHVGVYAEKRISRKSALQFGTELFLTESIKDYIKYFSVAYDDKNIDPNTDYKRIGL
jgi:hypothetical protein